MKRPHRPSAARAVQRVTSTASHILDRIQATGEKNASDGLQEERQAISRVEDGVRRLRPRKKDTKKNEHP